MALHSRKFLFSDKFPSPDRETGLPPCYYYMCYQCNRLNCFFPPPSPPPPPPQSHHRPTVLIVMLCVLGVGIFLLLISYLMAGYRRSRRRSAAVAIREDGNQSGVPVFDHHIWFIRADGFPQSLIDSITMFEFKSRDRLIEGSDCAVCLSEFREGDRLRLLPKCSHAFHVPCIDTWLRAHRNCPVCRAPVLIEDNEAGSCSVEPNRGFDGLETGGGESREVSGMGTQVGDVLTERLRMVSDLDDQGMKLHPMRRSVSMDFSSGRGKKGEGCSRPDEDSNRRGCKCSLQRGPVLMKRSFSFSGKRSSMRKI